MRRRSARFAVSLSLAGLLLGGAAGSALAGEITGNGKLKDMHGASECSFSGQEDLQWYFDDANLMPRPPETVVRGFPARAQSWGQIPKADRDFLATVGAHPGDACNPSKASG